MTTDEFKLRICGFAENMIDTYYGNPNVAEKMLNYTLKIIVKNNVGKLDSILSLFADENNCINAEQIVNEYMLRMGDEKLTINLQDYFDNSLIKSLLPNKSLVISANDLAKIIT